MNEIIQLFLLALLGSIIALGGGVIFLYNRKLANTLQKHSIPFAAGVLITVSLFGLIPEAIEHLGIAALLIIAVSFIGAYLFERLIIDIHHHEEGHHHMHYHAPVGLIIIGDTIHNFIDGITIAASFFVNPGLGFISALSTFLHEVPHEIGDFGILLKAGWKRLKILKINIISASATIIGAFLTYFLIDNELFVGSMIAVSGGIFLYLGTIDFLPRLSEGYKYKVSSLIPMILGAAIMILVFILVPHAD
jgi:zinc and cadmium transporter